MARSGGGGRRREGARQPAGRGTRDTSARDASARGTQRGKARPARRARPADDEARSQAPIPAPGPVPPDADFSRPAAQLILRRNQDRRLRGGHPWIFSNEVQAIEGEVYDGCLVDISDARGAFLGRGYYNHHSLIRARVLTRGRDTVDADFFALRIERAVRFRESIYPGAEAVRLVYGEADQLPGLVIDRYGDVLAVQPMALGMEVRAEALREAIERVLAPKGVVRVADSPLRRLEGLDQAREVWWGEVPEGIEVEIDGFKVEADPLAGQKTGLFLDQRENRKRAGAVAEGRRALDLFCYRGEWTMHMLRGGAASVLAVDSSEPAMAAAGRNLERNGLVAGASLRHGNAFEVLRELEPAGERFDLIVLDPPALVKSGKHLARGARAYRDLNRAAMAMLSEEGILVTCSCSHHLNDGLFRQVLLESARAARRPFRILDWAGEAPDHPQLLAVPETHYLKCAVLQAI